jgi:integrating conjugative element protein (TIGR03756 family)
VIGHPGSFVFSSFASGFGYSCSGAGTAFMPYLLSTLDTVARRYNLPELAYPGALIPGLREIGSRTAMNLWCHIYPRSGFYIRATIIRPPPWSRNAPATS